MSFARYDFLRDVAQCQVDVAMFEETQNWHEDGVAAEVGWSFFQLEKEGKTVVAARKKNMYLLKHARRSTRWVLIAGKHLVSLVVLVLHVVWRTAPRGVLQDLEGGGQKHGGHQTAVPHIWQFCWNGRTS